MKLPDKHTSSGILFLSSLAIAIFIISPNIACLPWDLKFFNSLYHTSYLVFFVYRYLFFSVLLWLLFTYNLKKLDTPVLNKRLLYSFVITAVAYTLYVSVSYITRYKSDCFTGQLMLQFSMVFLLTAFTGHVLVLTHEQRRKEKEIEQLKIDNLQSRYVALTNQINPHFFFNSLNGLNYLIRKKNEENAIEYVNKLSDVFRYVLQSERKSLVSLGEELECVNAFRYMMEVRFANKLVFHLDVSEENRSLKIPVLSLLPLIDNIVVHNVIDSEHKMEVMISLNDQLELSVSNPVYPKLTLPNTNGTGLKNLENRFLLLMNKQIRIDNNGIRFTVYLPLIKTVNEYMDG